MKRITRLIPVAAALLACALLTSCGVEAPSASSLDAATGATTDGVITVNASAEVKIVPDKANFTTEVHFEGKTAQETQDSAAKLVNAVLEALDDAGVDKSKVQTTYINLSTSYDWSEDVRRVVGYESCTMIEVSDVDVADVPALMQSCIEAGATGVNGPTFETSIYEEAYDEALVQAIERSRVKAEAMAEAAGVSVGKATSITESYEDTSYRYEDKVAMAANAEGAVEAMDIAPGEIAVQAQVTVSYAIT
ncbi:MAG: SIMPL domain-containing protein [Atopobiaceae bacterium]|nr:SIMPL domain-containing protein [Atopobiaceae bacterium]